MRQSTKLLTSTSLICSMLLGLASGNVLAQNTLPLPEGQTLITLTVTERTRVGQDTLTAELRIEVDDRDPAVVQNRINAAMADALAIAGEQDDVLVSTGHYGIYQYNRSPTGNRADEMWRGSQSITLESRDSAQVLALAGELQANGFLMNQLSYSLSTERADEVRDSLMEAALERAQQKAERAGRALGKPEVELATVNIDTQSGGYSPPIMMRAMADTGSSTEMAAPVADAGETEVTLTVRVQAVAR
ncbi:MAG: SIMPL domain-containing protein [Gammaproteobacteria bacterium]|nr:SIMPL domain-containing protein [Gammaproteobacteria bacterium]